MNILFTGTVGDSLPPAYGGIPKRALMLAKIWREQGHSVGLTFTYRHDHEDDLGAHGSYFFEYTSKPSKAKKLLFIAKHLYTAPILYLNLLYRWSSLERKLTREGVYYAAYGVFLRNIYREFKPDVIVGEAALIRSYMAGTVAKELSIPFVLEPYAEIHDRTMVKLKGFSEEERRTYWDQYLSLAAAIVASSGYCAQGAIQYAKEKTKVIYATTLDAQRYNAPRTIDEKYALQSKFQLPPRNLYVISVGAFTERKGHDHVIQAVGALRTSHPSIGVILCGAGDPRRWDELAKREGVLDRVHIFQNLSEEQLVELYKCADIYCDASNTPRACLGIALTEGMASRLPALVYNAGGLPEVVKDHINGLLVPLNDISALAEGIKYLADLPIDARTRLGDQAAKDMADHFDIRVISRQLLAYYSSTTKEYVTHN